MVGGVAVVLEGDGMRAPCDLERSILKGDWMRKK